MTYTVDLGGRSKIIYLVVNVVKHVVQYRFESDTCTWSQLVRHGNDMNQPGRFYMTPVMYKYMHIIAHNMNRSFCAHPLPGWLSIDISRERCLSRCSIVMPDQTQQDISSITKVYYVLPIGIRTLLINTSQHNCKSIIL